MVHRRVWALCRTGGIHPAELCWGYSRCNSSTTLQHHAPWLTCSCSAPSPATDSASSPVSMSACRRVEDSPLYEHSRKFPFAA